MLHEILLSLSGHPSDIWEKVRDDTSGNDNLHNYVSKPERAMLEVLAHLSSLHIQIKQTATATSNGHKSIICRSVASAICSKHLADFQKKILEVESSILRRDAGYVGGYGIVPLSKIVGEFAPWTRRLEWLQTISGYANENGTPHPSGGYCTGKAMLDFLQSEARTGYADIEEMATQLLVVGQKVWMRVLASWVLYGAIPSYGSEDFFVQQDPNNALAFKTVYALVPTFVSTAAAELMLSIGIALNQIRSQGQAPSSLSARFGDPVMGLMSGSLRSLESVPYPLYASTLETAMKSIDQSISRNALSELLPLHQITEILEVIHRYILLGSGEFAVFLIRHADERVATRHQVQSRLKPVRKVGRLDDLTIKDVELNNILTKTWSELASLQIDEGLDDEIFVLARNVLSLSSANADDKTLLSTLLPSPSVIDISLPPDSALMLFLTPANLKMYATMNAYLLSLRRAEVHLSDLWKLTSQRRCHPTPIAPPKSFTSVGQRALAARRRRETLRSKAMRKHWATASKILFVISELESYIHGEVIQHCWKHLWVWLKGENSYRPPSSKSENSRPDTSSSISVRMKTGQLSADPSQGRTSRTDDGAPSRDLRTLSQGHHTYLRALHAALLLENQHFTIVLKELLLMTDHYIALFGRLQSVWEGLDLQEDDGVLDAFSDYAKDEKDILDEMSRTRDLLEKLVTNLVEKLKEAEAQSAVNGLTNGMTQLNFDSQTFVPWRAKTMDRLIMRLDFLAGRHNKEEENESLADHDED